MVFYLVVIAMVFYLVVMVYAVWHDHGNWTSGAHMDLTLEGQKAEIEPLACAIKWRHLARYSNLKN